MKTKTITYHAPINNGSFFQAYALQKTLESLGIENEILDIQTPELKRDYALFQKINSVGSLIRNIISLLHYSKLKTRKKKFEQARQKYLVMTNEYESLEEYFRDNGHDDSLFIAGSDQIWNTKASDFTTDYMLPGVENKIAYSVSGGSKICGTDLQPYLDDIRSFRHISVREPDLVGILNELDIENVSVTLDPTLLLERDAYQPFISTTPLISGKYIFLYTVKCEPEVLKAAKRLSKQLNMPVYTLFNTYRSEKNRLYGLKTIYNYGPEDFLNIVKNAELVLSDSFHGNVFSIILEKNFYYLSPVDEQGNMIEDDRIDGLLKQIGLIDRKIATNQSIETFNYDREISYISVKKSLTDMRKQSVAYLNSSISFVVKE